MDRGYSGRDIRYWLLSRHYRKTIAFSWSKLETAKNTVAHLDKFIQKIHYSHSGKDDTDIDQAVYDLKQKFTESMDDDFNISQALAGLFQFTRRINLKMDGNGLSTPDKENILEALDKINSVLGVMDLAPQQADHAIESLIQKREHARKNKEWDVADRLRQELRNMGIDLIDTREGTVWRNIGGSDKN
jgi:cysteinyl-tRNA synthetase